MESRHGQTVSPKADATAREAPAPTRKALEYVVFDLETNADRADRRDHEIIQIGAVAHLGDRRVGEFDTLVRPRRSLAAHITDLTGLVSGDLGRAPSLDCALREFFDWVADRPMIAHNGFGYDFIVVDAAAAALGVSAPAGMRLDTLELAHIVYPRAGNAMTRGVDGTTPPKGRSLDCLAALIGMAPRRRHDALEDARIAQQVMTAMLEELDRDVPARRLQRWVLGLAGHPWAAFVDEQPEPVPLQEAVPEAPTPELAAPTGLCDIDAVVASLSAGGSLMTPGRKPRAQQAEMAEKVARAFSSKPGCRMMIEAPTGTGKTLAYLAAAIEAAQASGRTAVVTPHSRVLQDQILATLEELESDMRPFSKTVLKGMHNYISLQSLQGELDDLAGRSEVTPDAESCAPAGRSETTPHAESCALALAVLCGWVSETPSGDWADLRTSAVDSRLPRLRFYRWKLRVEAVAGLSSGRLDDLDFYRRALQRLKSADIAVLNHALLASGPHLRKGEFDLLIDEAHGLEDSATAAASKEVSLKELVMLCDALWDQRSSSGFVARIASATGAGLSDDATARARRAAEALRAAVEGLSAPLIGYVRDRTGVTREQAARYGASHRIIRGVDRRHSSYQRALDAGQALKDALRGVADALDDIDVPAGLRGHYRRRALEEEKARLGRQARDAASMVDAVLWASAQLRLIDDDHDDESARWINIAEVRYESATARERFGDAGAVADSHREGDSGRTAAEGDPHSTANGVADDATVAGAAESSRPLFGGDGSPPRRDDAPGATGWLWALRRVPLSVAGLLAQVWDDSHSVVLTSATLRVGDDWSHLIGRLGLGPCETRQLPSPFEDLQERHLLLLSDYLPAPRGQLMDRFTDAEASEIPRLFVAADGAALALMTARARLERVRDHARGPLGPLGLRLLAQGDASAAELSEQKRADPKSCLLGLRSFWEGVDLPGEALRLLLIEKVPFDSIGDPVVSARMDLLEKHGLDPFAEYLVPRAAIAFAQGVGRLIRTETDVGVTVVLDNRLRRPVPYADQMLRSLVGPPLIKPVDGPDEAYAEIAGHLGLAFDDARRDRIAQIGDVATLSRAALDVGDPDAPLDDDEILRRLEIARDWLGFDCWRPGQVEVMARFMRGEDVVAVLPTGSGKSVTYQIPALVSPGVTLVVSPLTALMRDQVDNLRARGVSEVAAVYAGVSGAEQEEILRAARKGQIKLLYVSPERLWSPVFQRRFEGVDLARIAVDEAHCISLWGHSFRPEYATIPRAINELSGRRVPVAAVTATATREVRDDIAELLDLRRRGDLRPQSVDRPEILYYVERCDDAKDRDLRVVQIVDAFCRQSAVVYVPTRRDTLRLAGLLRTFGHRARPYSGAMEFNERQHTEDAFRHGEIDVVVATKAFGLGIDKPDIALIVHLEMPASIEEYVQETGRLARGARDGTGPSTGTAVLLVTPGDCSIHKLFIKSAAPGIDIVEKVWSSLRPGLNWIDPDDPLLPQDPDARDEDRAEEAALALHYLEQVGVVRRQTDFVLEGRVVFKVEPGGVEASSSGLDGRLSALAEREAGRYQARRWSRELNATPKEIEDALFDLQDRGVCDFRCWRYGWVFERIDGRGLDRARLDELVGRRRRDVKDRADAALKFAHGRGRFAQAAGRCRRREMLQYLEGADREDGEDPWRNAPDRRAATGEGAEPIAAAASCGGCDACTPDLPRPWKDLRIELVDAVEALQDDAEMTVLSFVRDVERGRWSKRNLERALVGKSDGKFSLDKRLKAHAAFGRLALLGQSAVSKVINEQISGGLVDEFTEFTPDGREYQTLRLTARGRELLNARYPR